MKLFHHSLRLLLITVLAGAVYAADTYTIDPSHTTVGFAVDHLVINTVHGKFKDFTGTLTLDSNAVVSAQGTIQAKSIDTGIEKRDDHLRSADFFDVEKFPTITIESTSVKQNVLTGKFTMHGVTKEIALPFKVKGPIKDPWGGTRVGIKASITINRKDYGLTWNKVLEAGGLAVGEDVEITLDVEATKNK
jgi:polyisoprenoid-binding protein YceI